MSVYTQNDVIQAITLIANGKVGDTFPEDELGLATYNYDYYVRPGYSKKIFLHLLEAIRDGDFNKALGPDIPESDKESILLGGLVRFFFDEEYFAEQIVNLSSEPSNGELKEQVKQLTEVQLRHFLVMITESIDFFMSGPQRVVMLEKLADKCRKSAGIEVSEFTPPMFYYKYLGAEQFTDIICDCIDKHIYEAESIASFIGTSHSDCALGYLIDRLKFEFND